MEREEEEEEGEEGEEDEEEEEEGEEEEEEEQWVRKLTHERTSALCRLQNSGAYR